MVKFTDLSDNPGVCTETKSPADVTILRSASGTEVDRTGLHVTLIVEVPPDVRAMSASTVVKL